MVFMKSTLMVLRLACLTLFFASAFAAEQVNRRVDAASDGLVTIDNKSGSVEVRGWSRNEVELTGDLGRGVEELVFEKDGDTVQIRVRTEGSHSGGGSDLVIQVPENSSLQVSGISTDISVRDVRGAQRLQTISGDIDSQVYASDIDVNTVSGDVEIQGEGEKGYARFSTVSGDIDVENLAGEIEITSVSGDLVIADGSFERVQANTTSSDVVYHAALVGKARLDLETINGDVDIQFNGDVSARFDIETFNGEIRNCFGPKPQRTSQYTPGSELKFTEGGGTGRVTIRTLNGDLHLCKE